MSRENFAMPLKQLGGGLVYVAVHNIDSYRVVSELVESKDKKAQTEVTFLELRTVNGMCYKLDETPETIEQRGGTFGVFRVVK